MEPQHAPRLPGETRQSALVFAGPQATCGVQPPLLQLCPLGQALPHPPQFFESAVGSMQPAAQHAPMPSS
jgi:hypothetical protein